MILVSVRDPGRGAPRAIRRFAAWLSGPAKAEAEEAEESADGGRWAGSQCRVTASSPADGEPNGEDVRLGPLPHSWEARSRDWPWHSARYPSKVFAPCSTMRVTKRFSHATETCYTNQGAHETLGRSSIAARPRSASQLPCLWTNDAVSGSGSYKTGLEHGVHQCRFDISGPAAWPPGPSVAFADRGLDARQDKRCVWCPGAHDARLAV